MRILLDITCPRCGWTTSTQGLSTEVTKELAAQHVCPDGWHVAAGDPVERRVPGPGERNKLPEEKDFS